MGLTVVDGVFDGFDGVLMDLTVVDGWVPTAPTGRGLSEDVGLDGCDGSLTVV